MQNAKKMQHLGQGRGMWPIVVVAPCRCQCAAGCKAASVSELAEFAEVHGLQGPAAQAEPVSLGLARKETVLEVSR